jgi:uncharacterized CHY-type Zn-finger protein
VVSAPKIGPLLSNNSISKHVLNAQVSIRAVCCKQWFDCPECHAETQDHKLAKTMEMTFMCKKCRKAFRKDMNVYEESDEYCPHCDNHYVRSYSDRVYAISSDRMCLQVIDAKTPQAAVGVEGEDVRMDARYVAPILYPFCLRLIAPPKYAKGRTRKARSFTVNI